MTNHALTPRLGTRSGNGIGAEISTRFGEADAVPPAKLVATEWGAVWVEAALQAAAMLAGVTWSMASTCLRHRRRASVLG